MIYYREPPDPKPKGGGATTAPSPLGTWVEGGGAGFTAAPSDPTRQGVFSVGYGQALAVVVGTAKVPGQTVFMGTGQDQRKLVHDVFTRDQFGSWTDGHDGYVAPVEIAFAQGPVAGPPLHWWRGSDPITQDFFVPFLTHNAVQVGDWEWHSGDGTETAWSYLTTGYLATTAHQETSLPFQIGNVDANGNSGAPNHGYTHTIDPVASWAGDISVKAADVGYVTDFHGMTKVAGTPGHNQYSCSAGVYTFCATDNFKNVQITFNRNYSVVPGYAASAASLRNTAHVRFASCSVPDGNSAPNISAEIQGSVHTAFNGLDARPSDALAFLWTDPVSGLGLPGSTLEAVLGPDGSGSSGYAAYCDAMMFVVSRAITSQATAGSLIADLLAATNARGIWSAGKYKIIPLGDTATGSYAPANTAPILSGSEFIVSSPGDDPITVIPVAQADVYNCWPVTFTQRYGASGTAFPVYEQTTVESVVTDRYNPPFVRRAGPVTLPWITYAGHAQQISHLLGLRSQYVRNTYGFTLGPRWALLEPGDLVSLTEPVMGLSGTLARIASIEEAEDGRLAVFAEEWPLGIGHAVQSVVQAMDGLTPSTLGTVGYTTTYALQGIADASGAQATADAASGSAASASFTASQASGTAASASVTASWALSSASLAFASSTVAFASASSAFGSSTLAFASASAAFAGLTNKADTGLGNVISGSVTTALLSASSVTGIAIASGAITAVKIQAYSISGTNIAAGTISGTNIAALTISGTYLAAGTISGTNIAAGTISGTYLAAGTISASHLSANTLQTSNYAEAAGVPVSGAKLDSTGVSLKIAPSGMMIGSTTLDQAWFSQQVYAGCTISHDWTSSTVTVSHATANVGTPSLTLGNWVISIPLSGSNIVANSPYYAFCQTVGENLSGVPPGIPAGQLAPYQTTLSGKNALFSVFTYNAGSGNIIQYAQADFAPYIVNLMIFIVGTPYS